MRNHTTKSYVALGLAAAAFVVLAGCSADSPTAPKTPTPSGQAYGVTLSSTDPVKCGGTTQGEDLPLCATIVATVTLAGAPAPNGTEVVFGTSFGSFAADAVLQSGTVFTTAGSVGVTLYANAFGTANVTATVKGSSASRMIGFGVSPTQPPTTPTPGIPVINGLDPSQGSWAGGERVVVNGEQLAGGVVSFQIGPPVNVTRDATAVLYSPDGTQIVILTPEATTAPLESNAVADVRVTTSAGTGVLIGGFTYIAGDLIPEIYALSPNSGPISGGTRVTITGKGFQNPVQVLFGDRQATVVSLNYNEVIVTSPSITPSQPDTPTTVQVTVRNVRNGQVSNGVPFRYGEAIFISSISPNEGPADEETLVTIFGQGFESPVRVMVGDYQAQVISVSGTQIVARFPALPESARGCGDVGRPVEVTNINSNISADGPDFFYRAERTLLTSVTVDSGTSNIILEYQPVGAVTCTTPWSSHTLTLNGSGFQRIGTNSAMLASFEGLSGEFPTTYVSSTRLTMTTPDLSAVPLQQVSCQLGTGEMGVQYIDTPVTVTVRNQRNSCFDGLPGGLVIRPCNTVCRLAPTITGVAPAQGPIAGGTAVVISGQNFSCAPPPTVFFGGNLGAVTGCTATTVNATTPPFTLAGPVGVTVQHPAGDASRPSGFTYTAELTLTVNTGGTGAVTTPSVGACVPPAAGCGAYGTSPVQITASATLPNTTVVWAGDCAACIGGSCPVVMNGNKACTVSFAP